MRIGLQIPDFDGAGGASRLGGQLAAVARTADEAGFDSIGVMDHFFQIGMIGPPDHDMLEAYTTLGYLAGCTTRARLLTLVTGVVYRHPGSLERGGSARPGSAVPADRRAVRTARGSTPDLHADVARRPDALCRQALPARAATQYAARGLSAAPADHDRRVRRA